ncbi:hypothetical protein V6N11_022005 [Hibiscus sabdariffa]|uniref:Endonuclease/exonuclease/phosphatase domain-containing protein n=1 Tax=Hibiscus sabdariffa TaxID=183260 RepID=A0ABR2THX1_9ROSI
MRVFSLNIRDLGTRLKKKAILDRLRQYRGEMVCIQETKLEDISLATNYVNVIGQWVKENWACRFICVYAPCSVEEQKEVWYSIHTTILEGDIPWCICGDFNMVRIVEERRGCFGGRIAMENYVSFMNDVHLIDLPMQGKQYI